jgi:25S rRNA (adenine2142-N1)-methyltransferase
MSTRPRIPFVRLQDFFDFEPPPGKLYDVVSLSLVLNFVGEAKQRGQMLLKACRLLQPDSTGLLFVVLPRACVENSRYTNTKTMTDLAATMNLKLVEKHMSTRLVFMLFKLDGDPPAHGSDPRPIPRTIVRKGHRNNFTITL